MAHDGNGQEQPAKEKASKRPPQNAPRPPQNLIRSAALEKPTTFSSLWYPLPTTLEAGRSKLFHSCFRSVVVGEDGNDCASCFHLVLFQNDAAADDGLLHSASRKTPASETLK